MSQQILFSSLSSLEIPKFFTVRYMLFGNKPIDKIHGFSIDLGSYPTKLEAEAAVEKLKVTTTHTKFEIIESGKWLPIISDEFIIKKEKIDSLVESKSTNEKSEDEDEDEEGNRNKKEIFKMATRMANHNNEVYYTYLELWLALAKIEIKLDYSQKMEVLSAKISPVIRTIKSMDQHHPRLREIPKFKDNLEKFFLKESIELHLPLQKWLNNLILDTDPKYNYLTYWIELIMLVSTRNEQDDKVYETKFKEINQKITGIDGMNYYSKNLFKFHKDLKVLMIREEMSTELYDRIIHHFKAICPTEIYKDTDTKEDNIIIPNPSLHCKLERIRKEKVENPYEYYLELWLLLAKIEIKFDYSESIESLSRQINPIMREIKEMDQVHHTYMKGINFKQDLGDLVLKQSIELHTKLLRWLNNLWVDIYPQYQYMMDWIELTKLHNSPTNDIPKWEEKVKKLTNKIKDLDLLYHYSEDPIRFSQDLRVLIIRLNYTTELFNNVLNLHAKMYPRN